MIMQVTQPSVVSNGIPVPFDGVEPILLDQSKLFPLFRCVRPQIWQLVGEMLVDDDGHISKVHIARKK